MFSESQEGLQLLLKRMNVYCNKWGITVNTNKTVVIVLKTVHIFKRQRFIMIIID